MSARSWSLRRRLLAWLVLPLLVLSAVMLVEAFVRARDAADSAYDRLLLASALAIADRVVVEGGELDVDLPYVALEMLSSTAQDRVFYRVTGPGETFVTGYSDLPVLPLENGLAADEPVFYDAAYRGEQVRVAILPRRVSEAGVSGMFLVQVAQTRGERDRLTRELVVGSATRFALLLAVVALVGWFAISRGLAPLARLDGAIRARSRTDLSPLEQEVPSEVRHLVGAINQLLGRLGTNIDAMQRFVADASHQLRTPLAALKTQTELALREDDPDAVRGALTRVHASTRRTSRLANQLLSLARVANGAQATLPSEPVDLGAIGRRVAADRVGDAMQRGIDLGFEGATEQSILIGDPTLIEELVRNLVDNALRYCSTGARVTVRVGGAGDGAALEVEDDGPGIPADGRARVFERFYRLPGAPTEGCGLGLAIVREVAESHGGTVTLGEGADGRGLNVRVQFPLAAVAQN